jgi:hypothetical protein
LSGNCFDAGIDIPGHAGFVPDLGMAFYASYGFDNYRGRYGDISLQ